MFMFVKGKSLIKFIQVQAGLIIELTANLAMKTCHHQFAGSVQGGAEKMATYDCVVRPAEIGMYVKINLAVLLGNISDQAGSLHLLFESLVHVFLCHRVQETQRRFIYGSYAINLPGMYSLLLAEGSQSGHDFLMVVDADNVFITVLNEFIHDYLSFLFL